MLAAGAFVLVALMLSSGLGLMDMARWAATQQRAFHTMVQKLLGLDGGGFFPLVTLMGACFAYGFVHAVIPGHGKFLVAGAGLASRVSMLRLVAISVAASMMQAVTAIILVYGSFALLDLTAGWAMTATDRVLIPLSYVAIMIIGVIVLRRAIKGFQAYWARTFPSHDHAHHAHHHHDHDHDHGGCSHKHAPTVEEADAVRNWRDAVMLIAGIGLRPCTGAVFVLVAAWRMNLIAVGAGAAFAMAVGTALFIAMVAISASMARGATLFAAGAERAAFMVPVLQLVAGGAITMIGLSFFVASVIPF
ncbi:MAG: hypothetical protein AAGD34_11955 [Pseudomonadota bacterium]